MMLESQDTGEFEPLHHCKGAKQKKEDWLEMGKIAVRQTDKSRSILQDGFFDWSALKMTKCQITLNLFKKSFKCQNF